jgi:hypothetical protein
MTRRRPLGAPMEFVYQPASLPFVRLTRADHLDAPVPPCRGFIFDWQLAFPWAIGSNQMTELNQRKLFKIAVYGMVTLVLSLDGLIAAALRY